MRTLKLPRELSIRTIEALRTELQGLLAGDDAIELDGGTVSRVDTASLQLLGAFAVEIGRRGESLRWQSASPLLSSTARSLGLLALLGLEESP
jgi:ABC-type transporter Mla MlaB component